MKLYLCKTIKIQDKNYVRMYVHVHLIALDLHVRGTNLSLHAALDVALFGSIMSTTSNDIRTIVLLESFQM
jgi:hypothetical protein